MTRRVCETCRYFQEAGFARNGWCNHPQRKPTSDVRIVVRRGELACRNGWAQDLWEPRLDHRGGSDVAVSDPVTVRPESPASAEDVAFLVRAQRDKPAPAAPPPSAPVDVVVGEAPAIRTREERSTLLAQDPRAAILKARERYRARMTVDLREHERTQLPAPSPPDPFSSPRETGSSVSRGTTTPPSGVSAVPAVEKAEVPRTFPTITSFPEDDVKFDTVPEAVGDVPLPRPASKPQAPAAILAEGEDVELERTRPPRSSALATERLTRDAWRPRPPRLAQSAWGYRRDSLMEAEEHDADEIPASEPPVTRKQRAAPTVPSARRLKSGSDGDDPLDWHGYPALDDTIDVGLEEPEPPLRIAPGVPRMCRTCRDFRPADGGERGWCTNKWAFSHRRMVNADELPCETSIGHWWLPRDDVWLTTADVSDHGQPTPLVDQWLSHRFGESEAAAGTPTRKQRRS